MKPIYAFVDILILYGPCQKGGVEVLFFVNMIPTFLIILSKIVLSSTYQYVVDFLLGIMVMGIP